MNLMRKLKTNTLDFINSQLEKNTNRQLDMGCLFFLHIRCFFSLINRLLSCIVKEKTMKKLFILKSLCLVGLGVIALSSCGNAIEPEKPSTGDNNDDNNPEKKDTVPPVITIATVGRNSFAYLGEEIQAYFAATDDVTPKEKLVTTFKVTKDKKEVLTNNYVFKVEDYGIYEVEFTVTDEAGNKSTDTSAQIECIPGFSKEEVAKIEGLKLNSFPYPSIFEKKSYVFETINDSIKITFENTEKDLSTYFKQLENLNYVLDEGLSHFNNIQSSYDYYLEDKENPGAGKMIATTIDQKTGDVTLLSELITTPKVEITSIWDEEFPKTFATETNSNISFLSKINIASGKEQFIYRDYRGVDGAKYADIVVYGTDVEEIITWIDFLDETKFIITGQEGNNLKTNLGQKLKSKTVKQQK